MSCFLMMQVFFIYTIIEFWDNVLLDNKLMSAVFYDLCVLLIS